MKKQKFIGFIICVLLAVVAFASCGDPVDTPKDEPPKKPQYAWLTSEPDPYVPDSKFITVGYDQDGHPRLFADKKQVHLRGVNVGGWLVREQWMTIFDWDTSGSYYDRRGYERLNERFSHSPEWLESNAYKSGKWACVADYIYDVYESNYITEADFAKFKEVGVNCVRLPFSYMNIFKDYFETYSSMEQAQSQGKWLIKSYAFDKIDWFLDQAAKNGIYVILDLHGAPGSQNNKDHSGYSSSSSHVALWSSPFYQEATVYLWREVAKRYKNNTTVAGYNLINEPALVLDGNSGIDSTSDVWQMYDRIYKAIREVDKDHLIIVMGTWEPKNLPDTFQIEKYGWENIMYETHHYINGNYDDTEYQFNGFVERIQAMYDYGVRVPFYMGEFNVYTNPTSWVKIYSLMNKYGVHHTMWNYKLAVRNNNRRNWGIYNIYEFKTVKINSDSFDTILEAFQSLGPIEESPISWEPAKMCLNGTVYVGEYDGMEFFEEDYEVIETFRAPGWSPLAADVNGRIYVNENEEIVFKRCNYVFKKDSADYDFNVKFGILGGTNAAYVGLDRNHKDANHYRIYPQEYAGGSVGLVIADKNNNKLAQAISDTNFDDFVNIRIVLTSGDSTSTLAVYLNGEKQQLEPFGGAIVNNVTFNGDGDMVDARSLRADGKFFLVKAWTNIEMYIKADKIG